jgi:hypothetical protein
MTEEMKYSLELSFISTMLSTHSEEEEEFFDAQELQEEFFDNYFHKIVIKTINHTKALGYPIYEESIADELNRNGVMNFELWLRILSANPFSKYLFTKYLPQLSTAQNNLIGEI